jgi:hypothetical protein
VRRKVAFIAVVAGLALGLGPAAPAFAYGPNAPAIQANTSSTTPGGSVDVTGSGFCLNCTITLTLHSNPVTLGTTTSDGNGSFSTSVSIPSGTEPGSHAIVATDPDGDSASTAILVSATTGPTIAASSGLAFTGADIAALSAIGAVALAVGGMLILTGRRRRRAA